MIFRMMVANLLIQVRYIEIQGLPITQVFDRGYKNVDDYINRSVLELGAES